MTTDPSQAERQRILSLLDSEEMVEKGARALFAKAREMAADEGGTLPKDEDITDDERDFMKRLSRAALQSIREELAKS